MPYDRWTGRLLLAMTGMVGVAFTAGCTRSANLRPSAEALPDLHPAGELQPAPVVPAAKGSGASGSSPPPATTAPTTSQVPASVVTPTIADPPTSDPASSTSPASRPTPLLDAEIRRAESVNREYIASLNAVEPVETPAAPPPPATPSPVPPAAAMATPAESPAPTPRNDPTPPPAPASPTIEVPALIPIDPPSTGAVSHPESPASPEIALHPPIQPGPSIPETSAQVDREPESTEERDQAEADTSTVAATPPTAVVEARPVLEIAAIQLCSKVRGFGEVEAVDPDAIRPGQRVRIYCEMAGLEYRSQGDAFVSRLAAHIELRSGTEGPIVWEQSPEIALDLCQRPRRDYYVSYLIELPATMEPGPYRLRLVQTDLLGNRAASREIPITLIR